MLKKTPITEIIKELGLPEHTKFSGYAIHLNTSDEFLMEYKSTDEADGMWWVKTPEKAKLFQSHPKAVKIRDMLKPEAYVVWVWDIGKQYMITCPEAQEGQQKH